MTKSKAMNLLIKNKYHLEAFNYELLNSSTSRAFLINNTSMNLIIKDITKKEREKLDLEKRKNQLKELKYKNKIEELTYKVALLKREVKELKEIEKQFIKFKKEFGV